MRRLRGRWFVAVIRPGGRPEGLWALPKGQIDEGESGEQTAISTAIDDIVRPASWLERPSVFTSANGVRKAIAAMPNNRNVTSTPSDEELGL